MLQITSAFIITLCRKYSLPSSITVNTIDSYQGQERDIIIISNARTTGTGFLVEPKRLNVAMTRARKCLVICGNFDSLKVISIRITLNGNGVNVKNANICSLFIYSMCRCGRHSYRTLKPTIVCTNAQMINFPIVISSRSI